MIEQLQTVYKYWSKLERVNKQMLRVDCRKAKPGTVIAGLNFSEQNPNANTGPTTAALALVVNTSVTLDF